MTEFEAQQAVTDALSRLVEAIDTHPNVLHDGIVTAIPDHYITLGRSSGIRSYNYYIECRWSSVTGRGKVDELLDEPEIKALRFALERATGGYSTLTNRTLSIDIGSYNLQNSLSIGIGMPLVDEADIDSVKLFLLELAIACW